jgi:pimeloyl-ACP methyl ester carboxylesterase
VVFANDSGNQPCDWLPLGRRLAAAGMRAVVFTYYDADESRSVTDMLSLAQGRYAIVGASAGGRVVIEAAARHPAGLAAIVSLSGEREIMPGYPDILPQARQVTTPCLYIGTTADFYTDGVRQPRELHAAMHGRPNELVELTGSSHGVDLLDLDDPAGTPVPDRIIAFIRPLVG